MVDSNYLAWWLTSHTAGLQAMGNGAPFKEVSRDVVARIRVRLPPLSEQRRIAQILAETDALRTKRRIATAVFDRLRASTFFEWFGDARTNPRGLPIVALDDLCVRITDGTHQSPDWASRGHPFLFVRNIVSGEIDFSTEKSISESTHRRLTERCPIEPGDVLYSTVGTYGVPAIVRTPRKFAFQRHIAHIKPDPAVADSEYLRGALASPDVRAQADRAARGVAQKTLNLNEVQRFSLVLAPLDDQRRYARSIAVVDRVQAVGQTHLEHLGALFESLRHRAFVGEL